MKIPGRFLKYLTRYGGTASREGWLEIDIRALDLEGVSKIYVNLDDVARLKEKREEAASAVEEWLAYLGAERKDEEHNEKPAKETQEE